MSESSTVAEVTPEVLRSVRALEDYQAAVAEHARMVAAAKAAEDAVLASGERVLLCKKRAQEAMQVVLPGLDVPRALLGPVGPVVPTPNNLRFRARGVPVEGSIPDKLMKVLKLHPDQSFSAQELAAAIGSTRASISSTLCRLARDSQWPVESPERGHFRFKPVATKEADE